jgi:hypothetical protein
VRRRSVWVVEYQDWAGGWHPQFVRPWAFSMRRDAVKQMATMKSQHKDAEMDIPLRVARYDASN